MSGVFERIWSNFEAVAYRGVNTTPSGNWRAWIAELDSKTCITCKKRHGTIYHIDDIIIPEPPIHPNCRCIIDLLNAVFAGTATINGQRGADVYLLQYHTLPEYYLTKDEAIAMGWDKALGNLDKVLPGKLIGGDVYQNKAHKLPESPQRIWYEADINYVSGYRKNARLLYSNDGLVFVTYDHYKTFSEIVDY